MKKKVFRERYNVSIGIIKEVDPTRSVTYKTDVPTTTGIEFVAKYETKKPTKKKVEKKWER